MLCYHSTQLENDEEVETGNTEIKKYKYFTYLVVHINFDGN